MAGGSRIFISYSSKDRGYAERLVAALLLNGISVWYDQFDVNVGDDIYEKVEQGIIMVDFVGVVLTSQSVASRWVMEELSLVKQRELEERDVLLLPLVFEPVQLPLNLRKRKHADFTDFDKGLQELMRALGLRSSVVPLDDAVRRRVQAVLTSGAARDVVNQGQAIRSQNAARLVEPFAISADRVDRMMRDPAGIKTGIQVIVEIQSANVAIPTAADLSETSGHLLARILRALGLDEVVSGQRIAFFLIYDGSPLEVDETLSEAENSDCFHLQLAPDAHLIE